MMEKFEQLDKPRFEIEKIDRAERMNELNGQFKTSVSPEKGAYGIKEIDKGNGLIEKQYRNEMGFVGKNYYQDGILTKTREKIGDKTWRLTRYDDNGVAYVTETAKRSPSTNTIESRSIDLKPNAEIKKGNFTAKTDALGRPVYNKIEDLQIKQGREPLSRKFKDISYKVGDQEGHLIADSVGGPASKENIVPQMSEVNQSQFKKVENHIKSLKEAGYKVDYAVKTNYVGESRRPSSFEFEIAVNGKPYEMTGELKALKKIYNDNLDSKGKAAVAAKEKLSTARGTALSANKAGFEMGKSTAQLTFAVSTVDNMIQYMSGEISGEEMASNIAKDTGVAGLVGYGTGFVSEGVAAGMEKSAIRLIRSAGKAGAPAATISFGVESYGSVMDYAQGKMDSAELAYELGDNAAGVAGGFYGASVGAGYGAAIGSVIPGPGTAIGGFAGGLIGGIAGCAVASGVYKTVVEIGSEAVEEIEAAAETVDKVIGDTIDYAKEYIPEKIDEIQESIKEFTETNDIPFHY